MLAIEAFGETSGSLSVPGPLIRVVEGTLVNASVRNDLDQELLVHGLCGRDGGKKCEPLAVPPGSTRVVQFPAPPAGTYHYWATTMGAPVPFRELGGAFVVDPPGADTHNPTDRVFVISEWSSLTPAQLGEVFRSDDPGQTFVGFKPQAMFTINGLSWPATERLTYEAGKPAHWRVINLSSQAHPMHLHGFHFEVDSIGNGTRDTALPPDSRPRVVTQVLPPDGTMRMTWVPRREGNWLFHCHIMHHVSLERRLDTSQGAGHEHSLQRDSHGASRKGAGTHAGHEGSAGMAGMILGVKVVRPTGAPVETPAATGRPRRMTLVAARHEKNGEPALGFSLTGDDVDPASQTVVTPGPTLVLRRGEPVEITVVNKVGEPTAIHWHGMELESYYDGVHQWSGIGRKLAPMIEPDGSFVVRFTPPLAGTFIYHTHLHDERQLPLGLYGAMLVVEPGDTHDPATDHPVIVGRSGLDPAAPDVFIPVIPVVINGEHAPVMVWKAGARHRIRLINITPDDILTVALQTAQGPVNWTPLAKDGAPVPASARTSKPARQPIAVGETYDFEVDVPPGRQTMWLEVRTTAGKWQAQGKVIVK
jgi:FtsP/CotA-like multicopper oxidase with cupredoxin domain